MAYRGLVGKQAAATLAAVMLVSCTTTGEPADLVRANGQGQVREAHATGSGPNPDCDIEVFFGMAVPHPMATALTRSDRQWVEVIELGGVRAEGETSDAEARAIAEWARAEESFAERTGLESDPLLPAVIATPDAHHDILLTESKLADIESALADGWEIWASIVPGDYLSAAHVIALPHGEGGTESPEGGADTSEDVRFLGQCADEAFRPHLDELFALITEDALLPTPPESVSVALRELFTQPDSPIRAAIERTMLANRYWLR